MGPWTRLWDEVWDEWSLTADINDMTLVLNRLGHKSVLLKLHVLRERMTGYTICSPWVHRVLTWATWTVKSVVYMKSLMYSQAAGKQKQPVHLWLTVSSQPVSLWWKIWKGSEGSRDMFVGTKPHLWVDKYLKWSAPIPYHPNHIYDHLSTFKLVQCNTCNQVHFTYLEVALQVWETL